MNRTNLRLLMVMTTLAYVVGFYGCRGPEGPPGPAGLSAPASAFEGFAPGIRCATCHDPEQDTTYYVAGRAYQWRQSKHAAGGDVEMNSATCSGCHSTEGFLQRMRNVPTTEQLNPSPPGCFACHSPHARADFSIRTVSPVTLRSNIEGITDQLFDYGKGNICAQCHQPRTLSPKPNPQAAAEDSLVITTPRWHSHYGAQAQMLMGVGGFRFPVYTYRGNSYHTASNIIREEGCVTCHMAEQVYPPNAGTGKAGGHTMNIYYELNGVPTPLLTGCRTSGCHASITTTDYNGVQTAVKANLDTLIQLLGQRDWIVTDPTSPNYGLVKLVGGRRVIKPAIKAGALYNYFFVKNDQSKGAHNSIYTIDLLRSSIEELRKP